MGIPAIDRPLDMTKFLPTQLLPQIYTSLRKAIFTIHRQTIFTTLRLKLRNLSQTGITLKYIWKTHIIWTPKTPTNSNLLVQMYKHILLVQTTHQINPTFLIRSTLKILTTHKIQIQNQICKVLRTLHVPNSPPNTLLTRNIHQVRRLRQNTQLTRNILLSKILSIHQAHKIHQTTPPTRNILHPFQLNHDRTIPQTRPILLLLNPSYHQCIKI